MASRELAMTNGGFTLVDDDDFEYLSQWSWMRSTQGYVIRFASRTHTIWMHREIMNLPKGDKRMVDHVNGDKADNRRLNLRICSRSQNGMNRGVHRNNKSGYKGVHWCSSERKWRAVITLNKKKIFLGQFDEVDAAADAYKNAALKLYGEYACLDR